VSDMSDEPVDNIEAAMDKVAENMDMAVAPTAKEESNTEPASSQILIRASKEEHERWKRTAEVKGISMSQMVRDVVNKVATDTLDCAHPPEFRQSYPWAEFCRKCDTRLRG